MGKPSSLLISGPLAVPSSEPQRGVGLAASCGGGVAPYLMPLVSVFLLHRGVLQHLVHGIPWSLLCCDCRLWFESAGPNLSIELSWSVMSHLSVELSVRWLPGARQHDCHLEFLDG